MYNKSKGLLLFSGGLDSVVTLFEMRDNIELLYFINYGQIGFEIEKFHVETHAERLNKTLIIEDISQFYKSKMSSPMFTGKIEPKSTYEIPSRNLLFISMAVAFAQTQKLGYVFTGLFTGLHPDSTNTFIDKLNQSIRESTKNTVSIYNPFQNNNKEEIIRIGTIRHELDLGKESFTCYTSKSKKHCGKCPSCKARKDAFKKSGITDTTPYKEK